MSNFFVLGLPRSRTLWFSHFLSFGGVKVAHEHFSIHEKRDLIDNVRGYCDTNPLTTIEYGNAPVLIIERDIKEVINSIYNAFDKPKGVKCFKTCISNYMQVYKQALDKIDPINTMRVKFSEINDHLGDIWGFLMPDIPINYDHIKAYRDKIIKTKNRDLERSLANTFENLENFSKKYDLPLLETFRITDFVRARDLITKIWYEISEDNAPEYLPDVINEYWIALHDGDQVVGCYRLHQLNGITWQGHVFMMPPFRKQYSKAGFYTIAKWMLDNIEFNKLVVDVPVKFTNVMAFIEQFNMVKEGVNRQSFKKDGKIWDVQHYGMTREELEGIF